MKFMKLHLGCGAKYLEGYTNVDYPQSQHEVAKVKADIYQDFRTLQYQENSIDEIRNHHVFEHFNRIDALNLLLQWRKWLKVGGILTIETPDGFWCSFLFPILPFKFKMYLVRHLFGSQEGDWANHLDFWYKRKFKKTLSKLGFGNFRFSHPLYRNYMPNIRVSCKKLDKQINEEEAIKEILGWYILPREDKELFLKAWMK